MFALWAINRHLGIPTLDRQFNIEKTRKFYHITYIP